MPEPHGVQPHAAALGGDGLDGPTDVDADASRPRRGRGFVNPYNPCLPHRNSRTCKQHRRDRRRQWAPFDEIDPYY